MYKYVIYAIKFIDFFMIKEARRINIRQYQHIVYNEFLPIVLGRETMRKFNLPAGRGESFSDVPYDDNLDPRVSNEFASAAFRVGHTLIPSNVQ